MSVVRVGIGCFVVDPVNHPRKFLMGRRKRSHGAGKVALPGGHLEMNESWYDCAAREVKEETNVDLENFRFVGATNDPYIDGRQDKHYVTVFVIGHVTSDSGELQTMEPNKCDGWEWMTWEQLVEIYHNSRDQLFDPMIHFVETCREPNWTE